jgi:hypothetical protein
VEILAWILGGLAYVAMGGKMHNCIHAPEHWHQFLGVPDVPSDEFKSTSEELIPGGKIVVDHYLVAFATKRTSCMTSDVSGPAGNQYCHSAS